MASVTLQQPAPPLPAFALASAPGPGNTADGASEDQQQPDFTNVFAFTGLTDVEWASYQWTGQSPFASENKVLSSHLLGSSAIATLGRHNPVVGAFLELSRQGILCTWSRRLVPSSTSGAAQPQQQQPTTPSSSSSVSSSQQPNSTLPFSPADQVLHEHVWELWVFQQAATATTSAVPLASSSAAGTANADSPMASNDAPPTANDVLGSLPDAVSASLKLTSKGTLSADRDRAQDHFVNAFRGSIHRHLTKRGFIPLGAYYVFPEGSNLQQSANLTESSTVPACKLKLTFSGESLLCQFGLFLLWAKRLHHHRPNMIFPLTPMVMAELAELPVLVSPMGTDGRILRNASATAAQGVWSLWTNILSRSLDSDIAADGSAWDSVPEQFPTSIVCTVQQTELVVPAFGVFIRTASPIDQLFQPVDAYLMRFVHQQLAEALKAEFPPNINTTGLWNRVDMMQRHVDISNMPAVDSPISAAPVPSTGSSSSGSNQKLSSSTNFFRPTSLGYPTHAMDSVLVASTTSSIATSLGTVSGAEKAAAVLALAGAEAAADGDADDNYDFEDILDFFDKKPTGGATTTASLAASGQAQLHHSQQQQPLMHEVGAIDMDTKGHHGEDDVDLQMDLGMSMGLSNSMDVDMPVDSFLPTWEVPISSMGSIGSSTPVDSASSSIPMVIATPTPTAPNRATSFLSAPQVATDVLRKYKFNPVEKAAIPASMQYSVNSVSIGASPSTGGSLKRPASSSISDFSSDSSSSGSDSDSSDDSSDSDGDSEDDDGNNYNARENLEMKPPSSAKRAKLTPSGKIGSINADYPSKFAGSSSALPAISLTSEVCATAASLLQGLSSVEWQDSSSDHWSRPNGTGISQLSYLPTTFGWPAVVTNDGIGTDLSNLAAVTEKSTLIEIMFILRHQSVVNYPFSVFETPASQLYRCKMTLALNRDPTESSRLLSAHHHENDIAKSVRTMSIPISGLLLRSLVDLQDMLRQVLVDLQVASFPSVKSATALRGPLTLQQLSELADASGQYEKNRRFRKKTLVSNVSVQALQPPQIVVGHKGQWIQANSSILRYWDRLNLEPFGGPKHVRYVALVPQAPALLRAAASFFRELGSTYEMCKLGRKEPVDVSHFSRLGDPNTAPGIVQVPLSSLASSNAGTPTAAASAAATPNFSFGDLDGLRAYKEHAHLVVKWLTEYIRSLPDSVHLVVYFVVPCETMGELVALSQLFMQLKRYMDEISKTTPGLQPQAIIRSHFQIVRSETVLAPCSFYGKYDQQLKELCLSVYHRCRARLPQHNNPIESRIAAANRKGRNPVFQLVYTPAFTLSKPKIAERINLVPSLDLTSLGPPPVSQERVLHVAYAISEKYGWLVSSWMDDRGEIVEVDVATLGNDGDVPINQTMRIRAINKIWRQTTAIANQASLTWHIVVTKLGSYSPGELADWVSVSLPTTSNMRALSVTEPQRTGSTGADGKRTGAFTSFATVTWMSIQVHEGLQLIDSRLLTDRQLAPSQASSIESSVPVPSATPPPPSAMPVVPVLPPLPSLSPAPLSFSQTSFNKSNRQLVLLHRVSFDTGVQALCSALLLQSEDEGVDGTRWVDVDAPCAIEISLHKHLYRPSKESVGSPYSAWTLDSTSAVTLLTDIAKQFHNSTYLTSPWATNSDRLLLPFHMVIAERLLNLATMLPSLCNR